MRAIKFRGMHRSGGWYYGEMSEPWDNGKPEVLPLRLFFMMVENDRIDKGTVGQFTGLRDKNGKDVFEGDILRRPSTLYGNIDAPVEYHNEAFWCGADLLMNYYGTSFEVIGSIYENPELLK